MSNIGSEQYKVNLPGGYADLGGDGCATRCGGGPVDGLNGSEDPSAICLGGEAPILRGGVRFIEAGEVAA